LIYSFLCHETDDILFGTAPVHFLNIQNPQGTMDDYSGPEARIIGGSAVDPFQDRYPYFALMWGLGICGGVLISPSIVLSAAHVSDTTFLG
jgi:hypothetical protein